MDDEYDGYRVYPECSVCGDEVTPLYSHDGEGYRYCHSCYLAYFNDDEEYE